MPRDAKGAVGIRAQRHQAAPKRGLGGSGPVGGPLGCPWPCWGRLDHKGPGSPSPSIQVLNTAHSPSLTLGAQSSLRGERASTKTAWEPGAVFSQCGIVWASPGGSFQRYVGPQRSLSNVAPILQMSKWRPEASWPSLAIHFSINTYLFIEHRLCQALGGHRGLRDESHAGPALEALGAWQGSRSCQRTLMIQCGQCGVRGSTGDGGGGAQRRGPWPSRAGDGRASWKR